VYSVTVKAEELMGSSLLTWRVTGAQYDEIQWVGKLN
jgi:hypothetical protein